MLEIRNEDSPRTGLIVLRPNLSLSWQMNLRIIAAQAFVAFIIASGFALAGAWLILPFAGLEILILTGVIYYWFCHYLRTEVIRINEHTLSIEKGIRFPVEYWQCQRFWIRLVVHNPDNEWYTRTVYLRCQNQSIEIGEFLNDEDKQQLVRELSRYLTHG